MKKTAGFTLTEVVISIGVGMVIIAAIYAAVVSSQRSTVSIERKVVAGQDTRAVLGLMAVEVQMASYNPTNATNIWVGPGSCTGVSANQDNRGIQVATPSSITIEEDINDNGVIGDTSEIITYAYDAANQYITRSTNCGSAQPFLGDQPTSGRQRSVRVINTVEVPVFRYFDAQSIEIAGAGLLAGIPNIARIDITLWVETEEKDVSSGERRQMVYSTSVIPRNHVIRQQ